MERDEFQRILSKRPLSASWEDYATCYEQHRDFREGRVKTLKSTAWGNKTQARATTSALLQTSLVRATKLFEGAVKAAGDENSFVMFLAIRGHFEATGTLGYLHSSLSRRKREELTLADYHRDVTTLLMGARDGVLLASQLQNHEESLEARSILTVLKHADRVTHELVLGGHPDHQRALTEAYSWLSEFCHPNGMSNVLAMHVDHSVPAYVFHHDQPMRDEDFGILSHLLVSGETFVSLFPMVQAMAQEVLA